MKREQILDAIRMLRDFHDSLIGPVANGQSGATAFRAHVALDDDPYDVGRAIEEDPKGLVAAVLDAIEADQELVDPPLLYVELAFMMELVIGAFPVAFIERARVVGREL